jgi:hypothetical protein
MSPAVLPDLEEALAAATRRRAELAAAAAPGTHATPASATGTGTAIPRTVAPRAPRRRIPPHARAPREGRRLVLPRPRRALALAAVLAAGLVVVVALLPGRGGGVSSDLAARAYAAATRPGVVHWRIEIEGYYDGRFATHQRVEGWRRGEVTHTLHADVAHGRAHVTVDERVSGRRARAWMAASDLYFTTTRSAGGDPVGAIPSSDPLVAFRAAYRAGRLHPLGGGRFDLRLPGSPAGSMTYAVDPGTGRPRRLTIIAPPRRGGGRTHTSKTVVLFSVYEALEPTAANRARLALLPHPGAGQGRVAARDLFAALREGTAPTGAIGRRLRALAGHMTRFHVDADGIRPLADGIWLAPGRGTVCLFTGGGASLRPGGGGGGAAGAGAGAGAGVGGTCTTTQVAARRGISVSLLDPIRAGSSALPVLHPLLVVPDDVRAVKVASGRTFVPRRGLVRLPPRSFNPRLLRK